ncbi:DUF3592 domain-containing protein [Hymenobacter edaphi]|nr:DUF3592 domain-containing protein [Hymenobacter edaphi]
MPTNYSAVGATAVGGIGFGLYQIYQWFRGRALRRHGKPVTATIRRVVRRPLARPPQLRLEVAYRTEPGTRHHAVLNVPDTVYFQYAEGEEIALWYHPRRPEQVEPEARLLDADSDSPLYTGVLLVVVFSYFLHEAVQALR